MLDPFKVLFSRRADVRWLPKISVARFGSEEEALKKIITAGLATASMQAAIALCAPTFDDSDDTA